MYKRGNYKPRVPSRNFKSSNNSTNITDGQKKLLNNSKSIFVSPEKRDFGQCPLQEIHCGDELLPKLQAHHKYGDNKATQVLEEKCDESCRISDESDDELFDECQSQPVGELIQPEIKYNASKVEITKTPRIKILVKKFISYKKDTMEVRTLEEKVVCVEYDVFEKNGINGEPVQHLRAYFSLKPVRENENANSLKDKKANYKEVEIIDGAVDENESYLKDLKNILTMDKPKRNLSIFDVDYLYEKAKNNRIIIDNKYSGVLLTENDLEEIKYLILKRASSLHIHGFDRKLVKLDSKVNDLKQSFIISKTILNEINT